MKKFSLNLLKVSLLLVLGISLFSIMSEARAVEYAAKDIEINTFDTYYGSYEPGIAVVEQRSKQDDYKKNEYRKDKAAVSDFDMYSCNCTASTSSDFSQHTHKYTKLKSVKNSNGNYSSEDGMLTLKSNSGKLEFKVAGNNEVEHYRIVFRVKNIEWRNIPNSPSWSVLNSGLLENIDLYCISTDKKVKLTMDYNNGSGDKETGDYKKDAKITIPTKNITKTGHTLSGWGKTKEKVDYTVGQSFNITQDTTLYAIWTANATPSISLNKSTLTLNKGGSETLVATTTNANNATVEWSSNNKAVTVENGKVTGVNAVEGAKIIAKIKVNNIEYKAECKVSVTVNDEKTPVKLQDANGTEFAVGDYVKYTDNTNEGGWNLRKTARGKILGEIKTGTMLEVTEVSKTDICIKVKVLDGEMEGKEGWLTISAKENFEILKDYTPGEVDDKDDKDDKDDSASILPGLEEFDFGELNGILKVIWNLIMKLLENLPTIIEKASPLVETGLTAIGGLVSGLMQ